jgi:stearoyl-CoA desaturase (delta-9 desaturase)
LHALLQAKDAKLHELGERWTHLKAQYAEKAIAMKAEYAEKKAEYAERAHHQIDELRAALAEMRAELHAALHLLEHAAVVA